MEHIMELYEEAIEELMDAQKYHHKAIKASNEDEKIMYKNLARQELEHAHAIVKDGDRCMEKDHATDSEKMVWKHLKGHVMNWHADLHNKVV